MCRRTKIILVLGALVVFALGWVVFKPDKEPLYKGRSLREWVEEKPNPYAFGLSAHSYLNSSTEIQRYEQWRGAIRSYDTNAIPYLLEWIQIERPPVSYSIRAALANAARKLGFSWPSNPKPFTLPQDAVRAFAVLGPRAECAIPELAKILMAKAPEKTDASAEIVIRTFDALSSIGPKAFPVLSNAFNKASFRNKLNVMTRLRKLSPETP